MSAIAACFPNDVTPATISEMSKMVDRGARAGLHLFDPTIGKLEDKSDEEQNDVARLSYEVIGNFFEHGAHHSFKTLLQFGGQLMENTPCKMTRVAQKGGFKKVHKPTDDDCLFSSRFFELYETWTTRDRRNAATSQAILDEIAALPATPFALRVAAAWETDKATFRGRTEEEEVALDAAFKLADEHKSWDEVRKAGEKGVDVGKAWWGKGYEEVESGTALAGRVAKELAKEKAGSQDDSEGAERPQKRKKTTHPKKLSSTPVTSTTASLPKSTRSAAKAQRPKREATKLNKKSYKDVVSDSESPGEYDSSDENSSDESDDEVLGSEMEDDDGSREEGRSGGLEDIDELEEEEEAVTTEEEDSDDDDPEEDLTTTSLSEWKEQQEARGLGVDEDWVDV